MTPELLSDIVFAGIALVAVTGAVGAVALRNVFHNALCLILSLFGVAGLFIFLNSEFLAIIEVIIYIGAISVAIIFAIMLSQTMYVKDESIRPSKLLRAFVAAAALFGVVAKWVFGARWARAGTDGDYSMRAIGRAFFSTALLPFEAVSLVLLVAIIGALVISNKESSIE